MSDALTEARAAITAEQARRDAPKCPETFTHPHTLLVYTCNLPLGHTIERHDFGPAFPYTVNLRHAEALLAEVNRLTRERDVYKRAKAENDERYMIERDKARREVAAEQDKRRAADAVLAEIGGWCITHGAALKPGGGDADTFGEGMRAAKDQICRVLLRNLNTDARRVP